MTFPNHHTIVTGLRPAHHGVIHNNIYDPVSKEIFAFNKPELQGPQWWGGEPIWATAIKQRRRADVLFWPGTGTAMAGMLPSEWQHYDGKLPRCSGCAVESFGSGRFRPRTHGGAF